MAKKSAAVACLVFGGLFLQYMMRTTITVAIPAALEEYHGLYTDMEDVFFRWRGGVRYGYDMTYFFFCCVCLCLLSYILKFKKNIDTTLF